MRSSIWLLMFAAACSSATAAERFPSPVSPEESLKHFQVDPELQMELVAAEPQVVDPVAIAFDADGSLWVVEMRDYPHGPRPGEKPKSQIVHLLDKDDDGRFETSTVFADELLFCTGVLPYRDGLIVTLAGQIAFFVDRDGDGKAEFRQTWFSGFAQENSQLRANHPTYGPDGYVYVANGLRGGKVVAERPEWKKTEKPLEIKGFDFRFHPETGEFSTITGHGQFGLCFDDYGRRFICSNRNPCMHVVLEDWYLKRNPHFAAKKVVHDVCAAAENSRLYPISQAWTTSTLHANQFTAACGVTIYRGDALPPAFRGNAFTCDPTGNLVHREVLIPDGCTFQGKSPYEGREFLASPDTWFRPVNLANGPDGALYVVDMYRAVIEHPDFMPTELKTRPDLLLGTDRGRIYRIVPKDRTRRVVPHLASASNTELVQILGDRDSGWHIETASRLIAERNATEVVLPLRAALQRRGSFDATFLPSRAAALWTLHRLGAISRDDLMIFLESDLAAEDVLKECALRISEPSLADDEALRQYIAAMPGDDYRRSFQILLTLSALDWNDRRADSIASFASYRHHDSWLHSAALLATGNHSPSVLRALIDRLKRAVPFRPAPAEFIETLTEMMVANHSPAEIVPVVAVFGELNGVHHAAKPQAAFLRGYGRGAQRRGKAWDQELAKLPDGGKALRERLRDWGEDAAQVASDSSLSLEDRIAAIQTLRWSGAESANAVLVPLVLESGNTTLAIAACDALATMPGDDFAPALLERFPSAVPAVRRAILDVMLSNTQRANLLLDAVERSPAPTVREGFEPVKDSGTPPLPSGLVAITPAEIDTARANRLLNSRDAALKARAKKLLAAGSADRVAVLADYEPILQNLGDANRGKAVFAKQCVTCHRIADAGVNVGPDIGDTRDKTPQYLLTAILDPNRAVDNNYFGYAVATSDGKVLTGIIAAETSTSITLKQAEGKTETILRSDIEELRATGQSFMPVGFEKNVSKSDMADLIAFLKNWRYLDGAVPTGK